VNKRYLEVGIALAIIGALGFSWLRAHDAWIKAQATQEALDKVIKKNSDSISVLNKQTDDLITKMTSDVARIQQQMKKPATVAQVQKQTQEMVPNLSPIQTVTIPATPTEAQHQVLQVEDTQSNRDAINAAELTCKSCEIQLLARQQAFNDSEQKFKLEQQKLDAMTSERDDYKRAANKGHGFWSQLKHDAIVGGITAGVGYALGRAGR
jgi:seryl-tRNA synthetase